MLPDVETRFEPSRPLDLHHTLGPLAGGGPWFRHEGDAILRASRTVEGPATIELRRRNGAVEVKAWGPGAGWAAAHAAELCGERDDDSAFVPAHPLVAQLRRSSPGVRLPRSLAVFEALVPTVIGQLVTSEEARASYRRLVYELGEPAPGPGSLRLPPSPGVVATTPYWTFHRFGIERRRAETLIRAARSAKRLEETVTMDLGEAYARLRAFPGIGPWSAAKIAMVALGDADAVPLGDYHLPHSIGYALEGTVRSTDERMLELLEPYRGHRARVIRLITIAGIAAPRFGPRRPLRNLARM